VHLRQVLTGLEYKMRGDECEVTGISYDSRKVKPGDLFVAILGHKTDGHKFAQQAMENGAAAALVQHWIPDLNLPQILVENTRCALGLVSANFFANPSEKIRVLGITGTNGKTTCTYLVKSILEAAGYKVGIIGTIQTVIGDKVFESNRTTPEASDLQRILAAMVDEGLHFAVMEVSSHALELERTVGVKFSGALFTNLSQDHLDYHSSIDEYFRAKVKLFNKVCGPSIINLDDEWAVHLKALCSEPIVTYGINSKADLRAEKIKLEKSGVSYILKGRGHEIPIKLRLTGYFNVYNSLGAAALCQSQGITMGKIQEGLKMLPGVPGRFEKVDNKSGLHVIVDYAHTPDGLENILHTARELLDDGRLIVVFGAGGDRDKSKRPLMGSVVARLSDIIIITSDNPRTEDPLTICEEIKQGVQQVGSGIQYSIIVDRREAIRQAISMAKPNDLVIIAGKGHENYQEFAQGRIHFDDVEEVKMAIEELKY